MKPAIVLVAALMSAAAAIPVGADAPSLRVGFGACDITPALDKNVYMAGFGKGRIEGVFAPETAAHASGTSALLPMLALGIPGSGTAAILLGGLMVWGLNPGPLLFVEHKDFVWGLIASRQFGWHLQSYCIGFAPGILADPLLRRFWASVRPQRTKSKVIRRYELGLSRMLRSEAFRLDAYLPDGLVCPRELNPIIRGWRGVLDQGRPIVKRELVRDPHVARDGASVPAELRRRFDVDVQEWL